MTVKQVLNLVIPDETACVFVYRYRIECGSLAISPTVIKSGEVIW